MKAKIIRTTAVATLKTMAAVTTLGRLGGTVDMWTPEERKVPPDSLDSLTLCSDENDSAISIHVPLRNPLQVCSRSIGSEVNLFHGLCWPLSSS